MPKKIKDLKRLLLQAGFMCRSGKGSHSVWSHRLLSDKLTLSGYAGADAKRYQECDVLEAIQHVEQIRKEHEGKA